MPLVIEIPDDVAAELGPATQRLEKARELIALELYREGKISLRTMGRLAGVGSDYWSAESFRALHRMPTSGISMEDPDDSEIVSAG